jgi:hypothetical protein
MSLPADPLAGRIFTIRGQRVVLDADLARLYGVPTFRLNEAVKRKADRFPDDFRFRLTRDEAARLISQIAISSAAPRATAGRAASPRANHGGRRKLPWAFNEHGCLMAATVLNSPQAVKMSLLVVRAFVRMREALAANRSVLRRLAEIDRTLLEHDAALRTVWERLRPLLVPPPERPAKEMGFHTQLPRK